MLHAGDLHYRLPEHSIVQRGGVKHIARNLILGGCARLRGSYWHASSARITLWVSCSGERATSLRVHLITREPAFSIAS